MEPQFATGTTIFNLWLGSVVSSRATQKLENSWEGCLTLVFWTIQVTFPFLGSDHQRKPNFLRPNFSETGFFTRLDRGICKVYKP